MDIPEYRTDKIPESCVTGQPGWNRITSHLAWHVSNAGPNDYFTMHYVHTKQLHPRCSH